VKPEGEIVHGLVIVIEGLLRRHPWTTYYYRDDRARIRLREWEVGPDSVQMVEHSKNGRGGALARASKRAAAKKYSDLECCHLDFGRLKGLRFEG